MPSTNHLSPLLFLLPLLLLPHAPSPATADPHTTYHKTEDLLTQIRHLCSTCPHAHAEWVHVTNRPSLLPWASAPRPEGRLLVVTLTYNAARRSRARAAGRHVPFRPRVVATFGEHGRERITSEIALAFMMEACERPRISHLLHTEFLLLPVVNEAARRAVEDGRVCERVNGRGVDVNRNYLVEWGVSDADTREEEEAAGGRPLSEFESRAVDGVVRRVVPVAYVSFHSGDAAVVVPWDSRKEVEKSGRMENVVRVAREIRERHCRRCRVGNSWKLFDYRAYGTGSDHAFGVLQVPVVLTIEVYGDVSAGDDCVRAFNPEEGPLMQSVMRKWQGVLGTLSETVLAQGRNESHGTLYDAVAALGYAGYQVRFYDDVFTGASDAVGRNVDKGGRVGTWMIMASWGSLMVLALRQMIRKRYGQSLRRGRSLERSGHES